MKVESQVPQEIRSTNCLQTIGPFVLASDQAYAMPLATTLRSIVESNRKSWPLEFHVFTTDISTKTKASIFNSLPAGSASIRWISTDLTSFQAFRTMSYISAMTYARLLIAEIFRDRDCRVLYVDSDLLVLGDLSSLWRADLSGAVLGAVLDRMDPKRKLNDPQFEGVPSVHDYFNAGVMLIDLKRWREERICERALKYLTENPRSPYSDQDALNVACDKLWKRLDPQWNFQEHHDMRILDLTPVDRPAILHFVTSSKPWSPTVRSPNASFYDTFRSRTLFARSLGEKVRDSAVRFWAGVRNVISRGGLRGK